MAMSFNYPLPYTVEHETGSPDVFRLTNFDDKIGITSTIDLIYLKN